MDKINLSIALVVAFTLLGPLKYSLGQDSKVDSGVEAFSKQDFEQAIRDFDQALNYPDELSRNNLARAYFFRSQARVFQYNNAVLGNNEELLVTLEDPYLAAFNDLKQALYSDDGSLEQSILKELDALIPGLQHYGLFYLNQSGDPRLSAEEHNQFLERARSYAEAILEIEDNYMAYDILGQVFQERGLNQEARLRYEKAIHNYGTSPPQIPDFIQAYVYIRLSTIVRDLPAGPDEALALVEDGIVLIEAEYYRWEKLRDNYAAAEVSRMEQDYLMAINDLKNTRYDLFIKYPNLRAEAQQELASEVEKNPQDYDARVAYAALFEGSDINEAVRIYREAISIDSTRELAYFNIGVLYYNKARNNYQQAGTVADEEKYYVLMTSAEADFKESAPWFEKALEINPSNRSAISALKNVSFLLDRKDDYGKYSRMEEELVK